MEIPWLIEGMRGLGDNLYQRAVLREVVKRQVVYLDTPWPQIYAGLPVRCVRAATTLRTQLKNVARPWPWYTLPDLIDHRRWHYSARPDGTMLQALCAEVGVRADTIDFGGPEVAPVARDPYIVVRPVTRRTEWASESREPLPTYIARAVESLRGSHRIVSVADIDPPHETALGPLPYADETYHRGELHVEQLLALVAGAAGVVGGVGWLVPAAVAYRVPMLAIFGGRGAHNAPGRIFDERMDTSRIVKALPDKFCMCSRADHHCAKTIGRFDQHIERFKESLDVHRRESRRAA